MLANRRYAVAGFVFLLLLLMAGATGVGALLLLALALAWLVAMVLASFKPDLGASPRGALDTAMVALPLQYAIWCGVLVLSLALEIVWIVRGTHPNNPPVPIAGSVKEAESFEGPELIVAGLRGSRAPEAALWREQAAISDVHRVGVNLSQLPVRGELTNLAPMEFDDDTRRVRWVFSHDDMRFHAYTLAEQRPAGTLGVLGQQPFPSPPLPLANAMLATSDSIYQYDEEGGRILPRARVPAGEHVIGFGDAGDRIAVLSDRALYLYDERDLRTSDALLQPRLRVPTPGRAGLLARVDVMELLDGVLASFTFTSNVFRGMGVPFQAVVRVDEQGRASEVTRRELPSGYDRLYLYRSWIASPVLSEMQLRVRRWFSGYDSEFDFDPRPLPRAALVLALSLLALSLLLAIWRTARVGLPMPARVAWIAVCALVGLPALIALWLLYPPRERLGELHLRMGPRLATALLLCAASVGPAAAATPVLEANDGADLQTLAAAESARPRAPHLPREAFLSRKGRRGARLWPDGGSVAALVENGRDRSLWLADASNPKGRRLLARSSAEDLYFSHDGRWLFLASPKQVDALAMVGQPGSGAIAQVGEFNHREFVGVDPWRPAAVLLLEKPAKISALPRRWRLWRVEVGGRTTLVHESRLDIAGFAFAPDGSLSHLRLASKEKHVILHREGQDRWRALAVCKESRQCGFVGTANGGRDLLMNSNLGGDLQRLLRLDDQGGLHFLHGDPRGVADLAEVVLDPADNSPLITAYRSTVVSNQALRPDLQAPLARLSQRFPQAQLRLEVGRGARTGWLVREGGESLRGERLHLFEPDSGRSVELLAALAFQSKGKPAPRLPEAVMARQVPVSWAASDGLRVHGFLLLPPGVDPRHAPLVVNVHGGPYNQVKPGFNTRTQFLANRGYIVFSPNFRASTGYGRNHVLSSAGDFGGEGSVQRDIVEGTRWLLANGIGDPARVGIVGASYGGYATLLGLSFQPELFKVGVASVPPSDFAFVIREYLGTGKEFTPGIPMAATLRHLGIDPADRVLMAKLHAQSPVANVARMRRPLLLLAGGEDDRVPIRGVTDYAARLKLLKRDVSLFVDADAGHSLSVDPRTLEAYMYLQEKLLHRHLGGAAPQPANAELREHIKRNLRLRGPSLSGA